MNNFFISSSILSSNFSRLGEETKKAVLAGADVIHFDVMDNHYVPNISMGPITFKTLRKYGVNIPIDVHLMIKPVEKSIVDFAKYGADYITIHPESTNHIDKCLQIIKNNGCKSGLAFNPGTSLNYLDYVLDKIDLVLIMGVNPGFSGQKFLPIIIDKIKKVRNIINNSNYKINLGIDGGVNLNNIVNIIKSGVNFVVIGSTIFTRENYKYMVKKIRENLVQNNFF